MAVTILFDLKKFNRFLSVYEQSQTEFAGKVALTKFAKRVKGSQGLRIRYDKIFDRPVPFTRNSTFTVQRGLELDVGIKDEKIQKMVVNEKFYFENFNSCHCNPFNSDFYGTIYCYESTR